MRASVVVLPLLALWARVPAGAEELASDFIRAGRWFVMRTPRQTFPQIGTVVDGERRALTYEDVTGETPRLFVDAVEDGDAPAFSIRGNQADAGARRLGLEPAEDLVELTSAGGMIFSADPKRVRRNIADSCPSVDPRLKALLGRPDILVVSRIVLASDFVVRERSATRRKVSSRWEDAEASVIAEAVETLRDEGTASYQGEDWMTLLFEAVPAAELGLEGLLERDEPCRRGNTSAER